MAEREVRGIDLMWRPGGRHHGRQRLRKTTLLRLIGGQLRASGGTVEVEGRNGGAARRAANLAALRRRMGMLFQFGACSPTSRVFDNVAFPLREHADCLWAWCATWC